MDKNPVTTNIAQEVQAPVRKELSIMEQYEIKHKIFSVFNANNLSIRQAKDLMSEIVNDLEDLTPWNKH